MVHGFQKVPPPIELTGHIIKIGSRDLICKELAGPVLGSRVLLRCFLSRGVNPFPEVRRPHEPLDDVVGSNNSRQRLEQWDLDADRD